MKLSIRHDTTYSYADEVCTSIQFLRLTPQDSQRQRVLQWQLGNCHAGSAPSAIPTATSCTS